MSCPNHDSLVWPVRDAQNVLQLNTYLDHIINYVVNGKYAQGNTNMDLYIQDDGKKNVCFMIAVVL